MIAHRTRVHLRSVRFARRSPPRAPGTTRDSARTQSPRPLRGTLGLLLCALGCVPLLATAPIALAGTGSTPFIRGDANGDLAVDIGDAIFTLAFLFSQGAPPPCLDAADANDDGAIDIGDAIYALGFLFSNGPPPPPPHPAPGVDPTSGANDAMICGDPCGSEEFCNGTDDDCDGEVDEEPVDGTSWYRDLDGDTYGDDSLPAVIACAAPPGHVAIGGDCDDADPTIRPGATETCDGVDEDCDGTADDSAIDATTWYPDLDGDTFGDDSATGTLACAAPPGHVAIGGDCDDADPAIRPGATETCDGVDEDCDGTADDSAIDATSWWPDSDDDGFGDASAAALLACVAPSGHVAIAGDCDDGDATVFPGAAELCDGGDDDCDGFADETTIAVGAAPPAKVAFAIPGNCATSRLHSSVALSAADPSGSVGKLYGAVLAGLSELSFEEIDLVLPGVGTDLVFARCYRSRGTGTTGVLGSHWEHSYEISATVAPDGLHLRSGQCREDVLVLQPGGATYAADGLPLTAYFDGVDIIVDFGDGGTWRLAPGSGGGGGGTVHRIAVSSDAHGNQLHFVHDAEGRLSTITDTVGRVLTLSYDGSGKLSTLADGTMREWVYQHNQTDLEFVRTPAITGTPTGNDFPLGRTTTYHYTSASSGRISSITDPRGTVRFSCTYDEDPASPTVGDLRSISFGGAPISFEASCEAPSSANGGANRRCIVNDDRGAVREYFFDALHRCVMVHEYTGFADPALPTTATTNRPGPPLRATDPLYFETRYEWNADHRPTRVVHPNGNETLFVYEGDLEPAAAIPYRTNLRQVIRTPGTHTPAGPFPSLVESYQVAAGFGGFRGDEYRVLHVDARGGVTVTVRDAFGNALSVQHPEPGVVEDFEYDPRGRLTAHVRASHAAPGLPPARRRDELTYHATAPVGIPGAGLLQSRVVDALGFALTTTYEYDPHGDLVRVVDPSGHDELVTRNTLGEPIVHRTRPIDAAGTRYETRYYYDANGNRVRVDLENRDADGVLDATNPHLTRITEYDSRDFVSRRLEESGTHAAPPAQLDGTGLPLSEYVVTEFQHDAGGRLLRVRSGEAASGAQPDAVVAYLYDERDRLYRCIRGEGGLDVSTEQIDYDPNGNVVRRHTGLEAGARTEELLHDGYDRCSRESDAMGNVRDLFHDENGNLIALRCEGELHDLPGSAANLRLAETQWTYDALDRRVSQVELRFDPATQAPVGGGGNNINWVFAGGGQLSSVTDDSGDTTTYEYDSAERLHRVTDPLGNQEEYQYDALSRLVWNSQQDLGTLPGTPPVVRVHTFSYDPVGRLLSETGPLGETRLWHHAWHGVGRAVDERGNVTRMLADSLGRVTRVEADLTDTGLGGGTVLSTAVEETEYDDNGRRVATIDPNGHATEYQYDALDRLVQVLHADGTHRTSTYDAHDQCVSEVDENGSVHTHVHDALGRRVATTLLPGPGVDPGATFVALEVDSLGRVRVAANDDATVTRDFDSVGHLRSESVDGLAVQVESDDEGHPTSLTYPSGRHLDYAYDALGRVHQISEGGLSLFSFEHLGPELLAQSTSSGGTTTTYQYDLSRRPLLVHGALSVPGGATLLQIETQYDPAGLLSSRIDTSPGGALEAKSYAYDSLGRVTSSSTSSPFSPPTLVSYQLDAAGNRLFVGGLPFASGPYQLDPTLPVPADAQVHQYTQTPFDSRSYSDRGELLAAISTNPAEPPATFAYDAHGRLRSKSVAGSPPVEIDYDALGRVVRVVAASGERRSVHCFDATCSVHDASGAEIESYVRRVPRRDVTPLSYRTIGSLGTLEDFTLHTDAAGSVVLVTDSSGGVVERSDYGDFGELRLRDAFGNPLASSLVGNVHAFHGQERLDSALNLVDDRSFLDVRTGRTVRRLGGKIALCNRLGSGDPGSSADYAGGNPMSRLAIGDFDRDGMPDVVVSASRVVGHHLNGWFDRDYTGDGVPDLLRRVPGDDIVEDPLASVGTQIEELHADLFIDTCSDFSTHYLDPDDDDDGVPTIEEDLTALRRSTSPGHKSVGEITLRGAMRKGGTIQGACAIHRIGGNARVHCPDYLDKDEDGARLLTTTPGHKYIDTLTLRGPMTNGRKAMVEWIHQTIEKPRVWKRNMVIKEILVSPSGRAGHSQGSTVGPPSTSAAADNSVMHWVLEVRVDRIEMK